MALEEFLKVLVYLFISFGHQIRHESGGGYVWILLKSVTHNLCI